MIIPVKTTCGEYSITLENGSLKKVDKILNLNRKVLVVTDTGVPEEYAKTVAKMCKTPFVVTIKQGESSKNFENYKYLLSVMTKNEFTRTDAVVAVGGGVVGDLSGFVASSYMRGVDFYNIPTTLLSQVDSSIGGKVAIDFEGYKNIVGAFYPPKAVVIDPNVLKTLPQRQVFNGLAESIKMSLTSDKELFEIIKAGNILENIETIIEKSLRIKKYVVEKDEKENGLRKILNFGHTIAHAVESENLMQNYFHGECVAIGMLYMCSSKVRAQLEEVLKKYNLPTKCNVKIDNLINAIKHDKKKSGNKITVITVEEIGNFKTEDISFDSLKLKLKEAGL